MNANIKGLIKSNALPNENTQQMDNGSYGFLSGSTNKINSIQKKKKTISLQLSHRYSVRVSQL